MGLRLLVARGRCKKGGRKDEICGGDNPCMHEEEEGKEEEEEEEEEEEDSTTNVFIIMKRERRQRGHHEASKICPCQLSPYVVLGDDQVSVYLGHGGRGRILEDPG